MLEELLKEIDGHLAWRAEIGDPLKETTFGRLAVNDGKLVGRLRLGGQVTVAKLAAIKAWIASDRSAPRNSQPAEGVAA